MQAVRIAFTITVITSSVQKSTISRFLHGRLRVRDSFRKVCLEIIKGVLSSYNLQMFASVL